MLISPAKGPYKFVCVCVGRVLKNGSISFILTDETCHAGGLGSNCTLLSFGFALHCTQCHPLCAGCMWFGGSDIWEITVAM